VLHQLLLFPAIIKAFSILINKLKYLFRNTKHCIIY